jgi:hypothetical protein
MTRLEKIASLYIAITGDGSPTAAELDTYASMDENISLEAISSAIMAASPLQAGYAGLSNESLVKSLFQAIFNLTTEEIDALEATEAGAAGFAYWVNEVENNPEVNLSTLAIALINGADEAGQAGIAAQQDVVDLVAAYEDYAGSTETPGSIIKLTTTAGETIDGTAGNDTFIARIYDNQNTAQSGDEINGGAGTDRLEADIGNSQNFAITLETNSVEQFAVRAQDNNDDDSSDNNMAGNVQIDAERMEGTNWYESNNSRADVVIEDVRVERVDAYADDSNQITRDITIAMVSTDPGDVDLDVYFDQHSLVKQADNQSNSITLSVSNQVEESDFDAANPLKDIPYTNVKFVVDGQDVDLALDLTSVTTYDEMWVAMQAAFAVAQAKAEYSDLLDGVTMTRTVGTDTFFSKDGVLRVADEYVLTISDGTITPAATGWYADGGLPSTNAFGANVLEGDITTTSNLITSTVVLDDVGRGSMGGDLVIGGLSVGSTSDSKGVEQFDIYVDRNSELQNITSTNNTLEEVYVYNRDHFADLNDTATGSLTVTGTVNGVANDDVDGGVNTIDQYGFNDVRVFDASAMVGSVNITAVLSDAVVAKYMNLGDTAADGSADNAEFDYKLGSNDDTLALTISKSNLEAAGTTTREDFALAISGNDGDDTITTIIGDGAGTNADFWYQNSKDQANLSIDAGNGNDTITTTGAGDFVILAGSGNDTVYADNSGIQKVNAVQTYTLTAGADGDDAYVIDGISTNDTRNAVTDAASLAAALQLAQDALGTNATYSATSNGADVVITYLNTGSQALLANSITDGAGSGADASLVAATTTAGTNGATWVYNATNTNLDNLDGQALQTFFLPKATVTVTYTSAVGISDGTAAAATLGYESMPITITTGFTATQREINQAIKKAINEDAVLSKVLVATDGPNNTLVVKSLIDGDFAADQIQVDIDAASFTAGSATDDFTDAEQTALLRAWDEFNNSSATPDVTQGDLTVEATSATTAMNEQQVQTGVNSSAVSDNTITGGSGNDVLVLGTGADSNDTLVFSSTFGDDTVFNFIAGNNAGEDLLDFTSYLTNEIDVSGSGTEASINRINTTLNADETAEANSVTIWNAATITYNVGESFAGLTAEKLLDSIQADGAANDYANIVDASLNIATIGTLVGNTQKSILMVESNINAGEYKVFELTADNTTVDFTNALLVGTIDFGETISGTLTDTDNLVGA